MTSIAHNRRDYCKVAQLAHALEKAKYSEQWRKIVMDLVQQIDDVNMKVLSNKSGTSPLIGGTPLHVAAFHNHVKAFHYLLEREADFTIQNKFGDTALHLIFIDKFDRFRKPIHGSIDDARINSVLTAHIDSGTIKNPRSPHMLSHFHIACAANHVTAVQLFLDAGESFDASVNLSSPLYPEYTPLHFATRFCSYESAKLLLEYGADVRSKDAKGRTPLHLAIARNITLTRLKNGVCSKDVEQLNQYIEKIQKITSSLLDDNRIADNDTLGFRKSHAACTLADTSLAERYLQEVDVNPAINADSPLCPGYTHLHFAVHFNVETVKLLLRKGANIEAEDAEGVTPFDLCVDNYSLEDLHGILSIVPALENIFFSDNETKLMDFIHTIRSLSTLESFFQTAPKNIVLPENSPLWPGHSLSHLSILFSNVLDFENTALFFKDGRNIIMQQDTRGRTPIHLAFYKKKIKIVDLLLKDKPEITEVVDRNGLSHLHIACERTNADAVQILLSDHVNANVNVVYKGKTLSSVVTTGTTPLHIAVSKKSTQIIKMLIQRRADINAADADGITPIHCLIQPRARLTIVGHGVENEINELLLSSCDLKNVVSKNGFSHLHVASYMGNKPAIERLLKFGANINAIINSCTYRHTGSCIVNKHCYSWSTPLHFAARGKNTEVVNMLIQSGADILLKKPDNMSLLYEVFARERLNIYSFDIRFQKHVASIIANDESLQKRAKDDVGLTLLHIACYLRDAEQIQRLLGNPRVDVNAQMHKNSVIWPKATPLHVLVKSRPHLKDMQRLNTMNCVELLLKGGSDINIMDADSNTPVHLARDQRTWERDNDYVNLLRLLLRYHKDFSLNPVDREGVSHFHLACLVAEYNIAEQYLKTGVDVNLPIDFLKRGMTYQTPLLFMMKTSIDLEAHLQTMDVLLKYGADVNVEDEKGLTPLLKVAEMKPPRELYFEKLSKAGVDIKCLNLNGKSVLEILLDSHIPVTKEELRFFFAYSYLFNTYNSINGIGVISFTISRPRQFIEARPYILDAIMEVPSLFIIDPIGRTPIHNFVASYKCIAISSFNEYADYIERFAKMGFDIDAQDSEGKTALHLAAYFRNEKAFLGLLSAGADINLSDNLKRTAFAVLLEFDRKSVSSEYNEKAKNAMELHIIGMLLCGIEVNSNDLELIEPKVFEDRFQLHREQVLRELEMTKMVTVGTGSLTLKNFLSETGVVASRPFMTSETDRQAVDNLLESIDFESFPNIKGLIKLQYKKMLTRLSIMHAATDSVRQLIGSVNGFSMPEICCCMILRFLSNTQIKNLIEAMSVDNTE